MEEDWDTELEQEAAAASQGRSEEQAWMVSCVQGRAVRQGAGHWDGPVWEGEAERPSQCFLQLPEQCEEGGAGLCCGSRRHGAAWGGNGCVPEVPETGKGCAERQRFCVQIICMGNHKILKLYYMAAKYFGVK